MPYIATMPDEKAPKYTRITVDLGDQPELLEATELLAKKLDASKGGIGTLAMRFVIPALKEGTLKVVNGEFVPAKKAARAA